VTDRRVNKVEAPSRTSSSLLDRARAHDQAAWDRLVKLYGPLVYRWCRAAGLQAADAADVGQEVFRAVARGVAGFRRGRDDGTFRGWLRTITRTKLADFFRCQPPGGAGAGGPDGPRLLQQLPVPEGDEPSREAVADETRLLFRRAVELIRGEFAEGTWRAFWQVVAEDRRPAEVAADLGVSVNTVYLAKSRVLRRLREEFADLLTEDKG
jgi:RNA polymerase sigma-70 factor (ECF subfamily)